MCCPYYASASAVQSSPQVLAECAAIAWLISVSTGPGSAPSVVISTGDGRWLATTWLISVSTGPDSAPSGRRQVLFIVLGNGSSYCLRRRIVQP